MNRKLLLSTGLMGGSLVLCSAVLAGRLDASSAPTLSFRDRAIIEEVYNLWSSVADDRWPGASAIKIPIVYLKEQYEYAIGFPAGLEGFTDSGETIQRGRNVQVRKRTLGRDLSASFPFDGFPAVEIGSPEALGKALGEWVITAGHEMFHVFQAAKGGYEKTAALEIGPPNDSSWHLNFPFPYSDSDVMRLIHLQGYLVWLASVSPDVGPCSATSRATERPTDTLSTRNGLRVSPHTPSIALLKGRLRTDIDRHRRILLCPGFRIIKRFGDRYTRPAHFWPSMQDAQQKAELLFTIWGWARRLL